MSEYVYDMSDANNPLREKIVRCRDCKHFTPVDKEHDNNDWCAKHGHIGWSYGGFCAWAIRRDA